MSEAQAAPLVLGEARVGVAAVARVARAGARVTLGEGARTLLEVERSVVERLAASDRPIYGISTGLGAGVDTRLDADERLALPWRTPQARAVGVGPALPAEAVRAIMLARAAAAAQGGSGLAPTTIEAILAALNAGLHPLVPSLGSVGEGDLPPLAAIACALLGIGEASLRGRILPAAEALAEAGIAPLVPQAKEGLALVGVNAQSAGEGALLAVDAGACLRALDAGAALALAALGARQDAFNARALALRPAPGAARTATILRSLLDGTRPGAAQPVQSPLSFRLAAQLGGMAHDLLERFTALVEVELNHPGDNPAVFGEELLHTGNFDATPLAIAAESLALGLAHVGSASVQRSLRLMADRFTGLPRFLTPRGQSRTGFATVQKTLAALEGSMRHLALPVALPALPVADGVEDVGSLATQAVAKAREQVVRLRLVASIGLVVAAQAVDLRALQAGGDPSAPAAFLSPTLARLHGWVRDLVPMLDEDRPLGPGFQRLAEAIDAGGLDALLPEIAG